MELIRTLIGPDEGEQTAAQLSFRALFLLAFGILCVRISGRKTFAQANPLDLIVALVVGSNLSRMMIGKVEFFPALAATFTLVVAHRLLALGSLRWTLLRPWLKAGPVVLVRDGIVDREAMARHQVSDGDLLAGLRMEQVESPEGVRLATLEAGGKISVVRKEP